MPQSRCRLFSMLHSGKLIYEAITFLVTIKVLHVGLNDAKGLLDQAEDDNTQALARHNHISSEATADIIFELIVLL